MTVVNLKAVCSSQLPGTGPSLNAPFPATPKLLGTNHDLAGLPSSSHPVLIPENQACASYPDSQPPLHSSTRKQTPGQILDL